MSEQQNQGQDQNKDVKKFEATLSMLTAILGGQQLYTPLKLENEAIRLAVEELVKEEKEETVKIFKEKARSLIKAKREFDAFVKKSQNELKAKILEQQKKFTAEGQDLFKMLSGLQNLEKSYLETIKATDNSETQEGLTEEEADKE